MKNKDRQFANGTWLALADAQRCRLLCGHLTEQGTPHFDERGALESVPLEHEHGRPMALAGMTGHTFAAPHHEAEEEQRRFAGRIMKWLQKECEEHEIDRLVVIAPPRMLGQLRKVLPGSLKGPVEQHEGNLMHLDAGDLAQHPIVRELLPPAAHA
jgi:protein required for attachment to host cells